MKIRMIRTKKSTMESRKIMVMKEFMMSMEMKLE